MLHPSHPATEVTLEEWERRKEFVGFTADDAEHLAALRPTAEAYVDEVVDGLYERLLSFEETKRFFPDEATLQRVKRLQREYFLGLTAGDYGGSYLEDRLRIGRVHQLIGLEPRWYMGAYAVYVQSVIPRIMAAYEEDEARSRRCSLALLKLITLDMELAITVYTAARERVIRQQAEEILEVSTPVVQLWDGIVAAPLIGTLDSGRTERLMDALLGRIVDTGSSLALIDITGVGFMDSATAQHLIDTISAARLLGARVVLTGVRPATAKTLVHLGIDLSDLTTRSSLAGGLRVGLDALGYSVIRPDETA